MENYNIHCEFENPVYWAKETLQFLPVDDKVSRTDTWNYTEMFCRSDDVKLFENELIENTTTGAEFMIKKSVSYGDFLVITFLMIFLIFGIMKFLINFLIPKLMNFKR